jgi:CubicO group peptidase (beta-lactamase class C family)
LGYPSGTVDNDAYNMSLSDDWVAHVLATPMIKEPGYSFNFNSGNAILMASILEKETGEEFEELTKKRLFDPLSISDWEWDRTSNSKVNSAWGLHLKSIDMAKIGYLFIKNGAWQDQLLFDDIWRVRSTRGRNAVSNYFNYGYYWWSFNSRADAVRFLTRNDVFFAWGEGGQFIFVVPHLELVVVTTGGNFNANDTKSIEILRDHIFPAVMDRYP